MSTQLHQHLLDSLASSKDRLSPSQLRTFCVMCYRMIELFLSDEAIAAIDWVASDLNAQAFEIPFTAILHNLQLDAIDPDAARADENRFSFEVLKLLEASPLEAAKAAVGAVAEAARLQALYKGAQGKHGEAITEFDQRLVRTQVNGLLKRVETNLSSVNLQNKERTEMPTDAES